MTPNQIDGRKSADSIAQNHGFVHKYTMGEQFVITTYEKITTPNAPYVFYIEGDGRIVSHGLITSDPTPSKPMLLNLAVIDTRPNVVYLARPCQYLPKLPDKSCNKLYWTNKRLAPEVIASLNEVINKISQGQKIHLVGFSGGGGAAVLIAAKNPNVISLLTIAGSLDTDRFASYHGRKDQLDQSLNPLDYSNAICQIPQLHLSGGKDKIVPAFLAKNFMEKSAAANIRHRCMKHQIIPTADHKNGWQEIWPDILKQELHCQHS